MDPSLLRADCARCAALCCVAFAFDQSEQFGADKLAGEPCAHLASDDHCAIYADRAQRGFGGCIAYDCLGAGQRVVQEVFAGRTWRDDPVLATPMFEAFTAMCRVHELLQLLVAAGRLQLTSAQRVERDQLLGLLNPADGWSRARLRAFCEGPLTARVRSFIEGLKQNDGISAFRNARG